MTLEYKFYYWQAPFRGNFVQLLLEEVGARYERHDASEIYPEKSLQVHPPGMAPPYLYDCKKQWYLAQMPAILMYLGEKYEYLPKRSGARALTLKTVMDSHDVLTEITNCYGMKMWTKKEWQEFRSDRLTRWLRIFEKTGQEHGLKADKGFLLGSKISVADIAATALFGTLVYCFPSLENDLRKNAPSIAALCQRIEARPAIKVFLAEQRTEYGKIYCGGEIEKSLREMVG